MYLKVLKMKTFIIDVDGVMTTGKFLYTEEGKVMKIFGPDDNDGLGLLKPHMEIRFVTGEPPQRSKRFFVKWRRLFRRKIWFVG